MTVTYRDAAPADLPAVDALFRRSFTATFGHLYRTDDYAAFMGKFTLAAWTSELAQPDLELRLAERDGALLGFAKISDLTLPAKPAGKAIELRQLYLDEGAKGSGVADELVRWASDRGRARGARELFLSVYGDNHRAKRFYARHGFEDIGPYTFMVGNQADEDRMMRAAL